MLATIAGTAVTYHHPDHLSNRVETDATGTVTRTFGHLPFGDIWYETGTPDKWKFTSYERDSAESSFDYAMFRYYGSRYGRFTSPDRLAGSRGNPQSLNRYAYVFNDPVNAVDPMGLLTNCTPYHLENRGFPIAGGPDIWITLYTGIPLFFAGSGRGGGGGASQGLGQIAKSNMTDKEKCKAFFDALAKMAGISTDELIKQFQDTAGDAQNYVDDGPSSETPMDKDKFPGDPGGMTVGAWFDLAERLGGHAEALSQFNGSAIWINTAEWTNGSVYVDSGGQATGYGMSLLTHEVLHKQTVAGGFSHAQMDQALNAAGAPGSSYPSLNPEAVRIDKICF